MTTFILNRASDMPGPTAVYPSKLQGFSPAKVYHFSTSLHLPWILETKELRPGGTARFNEPGEPLWDFLWATANPKGDTTATPAYGEEEHWEPGEVCPVRFTLDAADFIDWREVPKHFPEWAGEPVRILEALTPAPDVKNWHVRRDPLPLFRVIAIHAKPARRWRLLPELIEVLREPGNPAVRGVQIGGKIYAGERGRAGCLDEWTVRSLP